MNESQQAALTLTTAIATQPAWLQLLVRLLVVTHLVTVVFLVTRHVGRIGLRPEPVGILLSFFAAGALMTWLHQEYDVVPWLLGDRASLL